MQARPSRGNPQVSGQIDHDDCGSTWFLDHAAPRGRRKTGSHRADRPGRGHQVPRTFWTGRLENANPDRQATRLTTSRTQRRPRAAGPYTRASRSPRTWQLLGKQGRQSCTPETARTSARSLATTSLIQGRQTPGCIPVNRARSDANRWLPYAICERTRPLKSFHRALDRTVAQRERRVHRCSLRPGDW